MMGAGMASGTSPFAGVNIGRGLAAAGDYARNIWQQQQHQQQLGLEAQRQNVANQLAARSQALQSTTPALTEREQGLTYEKLLPTVQQTALEQQALRNMGVNIPGPPGVPEPPMGTGFGAAPAGAPQTGAAPGAEPPAASGGVMASTPWGPRTPQVAYTMSQVLGGSPFFASWARNYQDLMTQGKLLSTNGIVPYPGSLSTGVQQVSSAEQTKGVSQQINEFASGYEGALTSQTTIREMITAAKNAGVNPGAELDRSAARAAIAAADHLGLPVSGQLTDYASNQDLINKLNVQVASQAQRLTGDRAYGMFLAQAGATPGIAMSSEQAFDRVARSLGQFAQLKMDLANFAPKITQWQQAHPTDQYSWVQAFAASHPPEMYASRVSPIPVQVQNGRATPPGGWRPGFDYLVNGHPWQFDGRNLVPVDDLGNVKE